MKRAFKYGISLVLVLLIAQPAAAQSPETDRNFKQQFLRHFDYASRVLSLAKAMPAPKDVDVENLESLTAKEEVVAALEQSIEHVKNSIGNMQSSQLKETTELYGQKVNGQAVLMQLITHYSEHAGQAIAYARMNDIVPPWSR